MTDVEGLKAKAQAAIDNRREWLISGAQSVLRRPEPGFKEVATAKLVSDRLNELGVQHENGIAITGLKGRIRGGSTGPTLAIIGEMDALRVPGHPHADPRTGAAHACGHHAQLGALLGVAVALSDPEVRRALSGTIALMAVPAEEFVDVQYRWELHREGKLWLMSGKQEFIRLGAFDDVDMAMMVHTSASPEDRKFAVGGTSNGHLAKYVRFVGKASHAGSAPHLGVNALQAAMVAMNAINAQRETLREEDVVRLHGIITSGGDAANAVPDDVRYEGRVRGATNEAVVDANAKMDRCLRAGALALGATVEIATIPGYLPVVSNRPLIDLFRGNALNFVDDREFVVHENGRNRGGSTDMGDVSQIMPAIHPYTGAARGTGHGSDYLVTDYGQAVIVPAKTMAMTAIDLLVDRARRATEVLAKSPPRMSRREYVKFQEGRLGSETYRPSD